MPIAAQQIAHRRAGTDPGQPFVLVLCQHQSVSIMDCVAADRYTSALAACLSCFLRTGLYFAVLPDRSLVTALPDVLSLLASTGRSMRGIFTPRITFIGSRPDSISLSA